MWLKTPDPGQKLEFLRRNGLIFVTKLTAIINEGCLRLSYRFYGYLLIYS